MRSDVANSVTGKIDVTSRDIELLELLLRARWLSTEQIRRRFFPRASSNAAQKRVRKLVSAGLLYASRRGRTDHSLFRLTPRGCSIAGDPERKTPKRLPAELEHFVAINDLRLWFEMQADICVRRYIAEWEYRPFETKGALIPDAVVEVDGSHGMKRFAIEVDMGTENAAVLVRKLSVYGDLRSAFGGVLIWVPDARRMRSVVATYWRSDWGATPLSCWIGSFEQIHSSSAVGSSSLINVSRLADDNAPVAQNIREVVAFPLNLSCREESPLSVSVSNKSNCAGREVAIYEGSVDEA